VRSAATSVDDLATRVLAGHLPSVARMISLAERGIDGAAEQVAHLYRAGGRARVVGVTGVPGAGKSTLVSVLAAAFRERGKTVGIVAIDPTSPISGGSILGDRVRMGRLAEDPGVFIRSMATRGALGGLSRAAGDAVTTLDAAGIDVVVIETVGVGQDEVEVAAACHTAVVVCSPGFGDGVQMLKAGLLEIADIFCVNKEDLPGAGAVVRDLKQMLRLGHTEAGAWRIPVLTTVATEDQGTAALADAVERHQEWLQISGELAIRERMLAASRIKNLALRLTLEEIEDPSGAEAFAQIVEEVRARRLDPLTAARRLMSNQHVGEGT